MNHIYHIYSITSSYLFINLVLIRIRMPNSCGVLTEVNHPRLQPIRAQPQRHHNQPGPPMASAALPHASAGSFPFSSATLPVPIQDTPAGSTASAAIPFTLHPAGHHQRQRQPGHGYDAPQERRARKANILLAFLGQCVTTENESMLDQCMSKLVRNIV